MIIKLSNISIGYPKQTALLDVKQLELKHGSFYALIGRNGAGKSSLIKTILGLNQPLSGTIDVNGSALTTYSTSEKARLMSFVASTNSPLPSMSVNEYVALGTYNQTGFFGKRTKEINQSIEKSIQFCDLESYSDKNIQTLSDGERQLAKLARAIVQNSEAILLDEPANFLDIVNKEKTFSLLQKLAKDHNKLIVASSHEVTLALEYADFVLGINRKKQLTSYDAIEQIKQECFALADCD